MKRRVASTVLRDRAISMGFLGGLLTTLAGLMGYFVVPLLTGDELSTVVTSAGFHMREYSVWYHGTVLALPSFVATFSGTLLFRRWKITGQSPVFKLIGGVVGVPLVASVMVYVIIAVSIGVIGGLVQMEGSLIGVIEAIFGMFLFTGLALIFGLFALEYVVPIVFAGVILGAISGFLLAAGFIRVIAVVQPDR